MAAENTTSTAAESSAGTQLLAYDLHDIPPGYLQCQPGGTRDSIFYVQSAKPLHNQQIAGHLGPVSSPRACRHNRADGVQESLIGSKVNTKPIGNKCITQFAEVYPLLSCVLLCESQEPLGST